MKKFIFIIPIMYLFALVSCERNELSNNGASDDISSASVKVNSIAEFLAQADHNVITCIDNIVTVTYQNGPYLYVKDNTGALLVYGDAGQTFQNGDFIRGICGKYYVYYNLPEMKVESATFGGGSAGHTYSAHPEVVSSISNEDISKYVKLENVQFTTDVNFNASQKTTATMTNGLKVHNNFYITANCSATKKYNITGFVTIFYNELEIFPISIEEYTTSSGSGGSSTGGGTSQPTEQWVAVSASGYAPYWYCPTDRTTTPSSPISLSNINAYKNTSTGAYKVVYAYEEYSAHKGYNKLTIDRESHTTYNSITGHWGVCTDYNYFEFTIY